MSEICVYTLPILGHISVDKPLAFHIDDIYIEFFQFQRVLTEVLIQVEIYEHQKQKPPQNVSFWIDEPRGLEVEEIVLQISNGFSLFTNSNVEILFESRSVEWTRDSYYIGENNNVDNDIDLPKYVKKLSMPLFIRSVLAGCIDKQHDPAVTFYTRGAADGSSKRFIEAFYNLFYFLEYLYGNGKSGQSKVLKEFLKSDELVEATKKAINDNAVGQIVSEDFSKKLKTMSVQEILAHLITVRGMLHHPNYKRSGMWSPGKQRRFANESVLLQFICMNIAHARYYPRVFTRKIEKAYKKVGRCIRRGSNIRVVTK